MKLQKEWNALLSSLEAEFGAIDATYQRELSNAEKRDSGWIKKRDGLRKDVDRMIDEIKDRHLREEVKAKISERACHTDPKAYFLRLCYYIDELNDIKIPNKVKRENPDYGKTIVEDIARCASEILGYISHVDGERRTDVSPAKRTAANAIKEKWNETLGGPMKELAHEEAAELIAEIEAEVAHG